MRKLNDYLMNAVDRAYGLIDDTDDLELSDEAKSLKLKALSAVSEYFDFLEEE